MKTLLLLAGALLVCLPAFAAPPIVDPAAKREWDTLHSTIQQGMDGYLHDKAFTDEQNQVLAAQFDRAVQLLNRNPGLAVNVVKTANDLTLGLRVVKGAEGSMI